MSPRYPACNCELKRKLIKYVNRSAVNETTALSFCYRDLYVMPTGPAGNTPREGERKKKKERLPVCTIILRSNCSWRPDILDPRTNLTGSVDPKTLLRARDLGPPGLTIRVRSNGACVHPRERTYICTRILDAPIREATFERTKRIAPSARPSVRPRGGAPRTPAQLILRHWLAIGGRSTGKNEGESIAGRKSEGDEQKKSKRGRERR